MLQMILRWLIFFLIWGRYMFASISLEIWEGGFGVSCSSIDSLTYKPHIYL